ncbi:hypothetical protein THRCLA_04881 [Thraustotheca clavata]|uniref:PX domain-containing protein n=1 Tax=Thraustotheca clavata TaxID=74557 RepID=A0A1V9ZXP7_9STRA|nr:hypothetical protein THRCLA_04881 [Thraustotheca clavata]
MDSALSEWLLHEIDLALYVTAGVSLSIVSGFLSWCFLQTHYYHKAPPLVQIMQDQDNTPLNLCDAQVRMTHVQLLDEDKYAVYNIVLTCGKHKRVLRKRYSDFVQLLTTIKRDLKYSQSKAAIPLLPSKSFIHQTNAEFLEKRKQGLQLFLCQVLMNPKLAHLSCVREFCDVQ